MAISALQSLELIERLHAYDGVAPPKRENEGRMQWVGTFLGVAGVPVLVGEGELAEVIETPPSPVPRPGCWALRLSRVACCRC